MGSKVSKILKSIAPVALPILGTLAAPGIGTALGSSLGASTLGALGGGLGGAAGGAIKGGGLSGALKGGALGAAGGYLSSGGAGELLGGTALGNTLGLSAPEGGSLIGNALGSSASSPNTLGNILSGSSLGTAAGTPLAGGVGPTEGSGLLGGATRAFSDIGSALSSGTGGGGSSYSGLGAILGGVNSLSANEQAQDDLLEAQRNSLNTIQPYLESGAASNSRLSELLGTGGNSGAADYGSLTKPFTAEDLTNDPGYQFQLEEGQRAIDRSLGAKGKVFSGEALKAAQEFGTGLADQTYKDAYARDAANKAQTYSMFSNQAGQGQNAAGSAANIYQGTGSAKANAGISSSNILNQTLSSLLSGSGAKRLIGYGRNGQPLYE